MTDVMETAILHVQLVRRGNYRRDSTLRVVSTTFEPPTIREPHSIVVALKINVPRSAFVEPHISADINVPADKIHDRVDSVDVEVQ